MCSLYVTARRGLALTCRLRSPEVPFASTPMAASQRRVLMTSAGVLFTNSLGWTCSLRLVDDALESTCPWRSLNAAPAEQGECGPSLDMAPAIPSRRAMADIIEHRAMPVNGKDAMQDAVQDTVQDALHGPPASLTAELGFGLYGTSVKFSQDGRVVDHQRYHVFAHDVASAAPFLPTHPMRAVRLRRALEILNAPSLAYAWLDHCTPWMEDTSDESIGVGFGASTAAAKLYIGARRPTELPDVPLTQLQSLHEWAEHTAHANTDDLVALEWSRADSSLVRIKYYHSPVGSSLGTHLQQFALPSSALYERIMASWSPATPMQLVWCSQPFVPNDVEYLPSSILSEAPNRIVIPLFDPSQRVALQESTLRSLKPFTSGGVLRAEKDSQALMWVKHTLERDDFHPESVQIAQLAGGSSYSYSIYTTRTLRRGRALLSHQIDTTDELGTFPAGGHLALLAPVRARAGGLPPLSFSKRAPHRGRSLWGGDGGGGSGGDTAAAAAATSMADAEFGVAAEAAAAEGAAAAAAASDAEAAHFGAVAGYTSGMMADMAHANAVSEAESFGATMGGFAVGLSMGTSLPGSAKGLVSATLGRLSVSGLVSSFAVGFAIGFAVGAAGGPAGVASGVIGGLVSVAADIAGAVAAAVAETSFSLSKETADVIGFAVSSIAGGFVGLGPSAFSGISAFGQALGRETAVAAATNAAVSEAQDATAAAVDAVTGRRLGFSNSSESSQQLALKVYEGLTPRETFVQSLEEIAMLADMQERLVGLVNRRRAVDHLTGFYSFGRHANRINAYAQAQGVNNPASVVLNGRKWQAFYEQEQQLAEDGRGVCVDNCVDSKSPLECLESKWSCLTAMPYSLVSWRLDTLAQTLGC